MALDLVQIRMILTGGSEVKAETAAVNAELEQTGATASAVSRKTAAQGTAIASSLKKQGAAMRTVGSSMSRYVSLPLLAVGAASTYMAANFNRQMNLIATDAGGSAKEVEGLKTQVLSLSRESQFSPTELAESLFHVESSGYRSAKAIRVLNEAQKLATAGNSDMQKTTYALVSAVKSLNSGDSLKGVTKTAAQLNEIVSHGDIRLEELTSAMSTGLIPTAKALGLNVADVGSALDVMTKRGIPAQRSAYALNFVLQKLVPSTEKAEAAFQALGIGHEQLLKMAQTHGLPSALSLLHEKLAPMTKGGEVSAIDEMFGGGRMSKGLLVDIQHVGEMKKLWKEVDGNVGLYKKHVREAEAQPLVKMKAAWSSIQASLIELGEVLLPAVVPTLETIATGIEWIAKGFAAMPKPFRDVAIGISLILIVAGPMLIFLGALAGALDALGIAELVALGPVGLVIAAVAALAIGFYEAYHKVKFFREGVDAVVGFVKTHWRIVGPLLLAPFSPFLAIAVLVVGHLNWIKNAINNVAHFFAALPGRVLSGIQALPEMIGTIVGKMISFWATLPIRMQVFVVRMVAKVIGFLIAKGPALVAAGAGIVAKLAVGIYNKAPAIWNWLHSLPGKLLSVIESIAGKLAEVGASIASKIAHGLLHALPGPVREALEEAGGVAGEVGGFIKGLSPFAAGTNFAPGGLALVGERGPEIVNLPRGSQVIPAERTQRLLSGGDGEIQGSNRAASLSAAGGRRTSLHALEFKLKGRPVAEAVVELQEDDEARL